MLKIKRRIVNVTRKPCREFLRFLSNFWWDFKEYASLILTIVLATILFLPVFIYNIAKFLYSVFGELKYSNEELEAEEAERKALELEEEGQ